MRRMKKAASLALALVLCLGLLAVPAGAASGEAIDAAYQLYEKGLFMGTGTDSDGAPIFELDRAPTRHEAVTMLVRLLGKESEAQSGTGRTPFTDVADWAKPYVGYAYANGLTNGTSATTYSGAETVTASQYLTFVLRTLGYESGTDFRWDAAWELSDDIGLTDGAYDAGTSYFTRGDVAIVSLRSLSTAHKDDTTPVIKPGPTVDPGVVGPTGGTQQCTHSYDSKGVCTKCGEMYPYKVTETYFEVKLTAEAYVQSKPYGDPAYYQYTQSYVGGKYTVIGTAVNHYGTTWYEIARDRWICSDRCEVVGQRDFVTISGETSPSGTLPQGSSFGLRGVVQTAVGKIVQLRGAIVDASGNTVQEAICYPNATSDNLRYSINDDLIFNTLAAGSYRYLVEVWTESDGVQTYTLLVSSDFTVAGGGSTAGPVGDGYTYGGRTYTMVPNFRSAYCFDQNDYARFENGSGQNRGCTATAMCIAYSLYHDTTLSPNSVAWSSDGTSWEYCTRYVSGGRTYTGGTFTQAEALQAAYDCVLSSQMPMIVGVNGYSSDHVVTVVGVAQGASRSSLSLSDFLIVDPYGGAVRSLSYFNSLDCGWALRVPV